MQDLQSLAARSWNWDNQQPMQIQRAQSPDVLQSVLGIVSKIYPAVGAVSGLLGKKDQQQPMQQPTSQGQRPNEEQMKSIAAAEAKSNFTLDFIDRQLMGIE